MENESFGCPSEVLHFAQVLELFCCASFSLGLHSQQILVFSIVSSTSSDSKVNFDSEDSEIYYIAEDMKKDLTR